MRCTSLSGLCWAMKTGIFILGTLTIMNVIKQEKIYIIDSDLVGRMQLIKKLS